MHLSSVQKLATPDDPHVIDGNASTITDISAQKAEHPGMIYAGTFHFAHRTATKSRGDSNESRSLTHHCKSLRGLRLRRSSCVARERPESFFSSRAIRFSVAHEVR